MTSKDILQIRLQNQNLSHQEFISPQELVDWFGAIQSQDFSAAKWALSQRLGYLSNEKIQKSFDDGEILRTHVMRPTWHFVHFDDIFWMLRLTGSKVKRMMGSYNKQLGLTEEIFIKSEKIIEKILENKNYLNRNEIAEKLKENGIKWTGNGLSHILMWAELDAIICSGPMIHKKQTYALIRERTKNTKSIAEDEALSKLVEKYFRSHGPAQIKDFVWWSGLTVEKTKRGIEAKRSEIREAEVNGKYYYYFEPEKNIESNRIYLIPNYDEYTVSYADRSDLFENVDHEKLDARQNALFNNAVIIEGKVEGLWRREVKTKRIEIEFRMFRKLSPYELKKIEEEANKYSLFLGKEQTSTFI